MYTYIYIFIYFLESRAWEWIICLITWETSTQQDASSLSLARIFNKVHSWVDSDCLVRLMRLFSSDLRLVRKRWTAENSSSKETLSWHTYDTDKEREQDRKKRSDLNRMFCECLIWICLCTVLTSWAQIIAPMSLRSLSSTWKMSSVLLFWTVPSSCSSANSLWVAMSIS